MSIASGEATEEVTGEAPATGAMGEGLRCSLLLPCVDACGLPDRLSPSVLFDLLTLPSLLALGLINAEAAAWCSCCCCEGDGVEARLLPVARGLSQPIGDGGNKPGGGSECIPPALPPHPPGDIPMPAGPGGPGKDMPPAARKLRDKLLK